MLSADRYLLSRGTVSLKEYKVAEHVNSIFYYHKDNSPTKELGCCTKRGANQFGCYRDPSIN